MTSIIITELEATAGFTHQDGNYLDFREQGIQCFFIDKGLKVLKEGNKYRLTVELIKEEKED